MPPPWAEGPTEFLNVLNKCLPQGLSEAEKNGDLPTGVTTDMFITGGFKLLGLSMMTFVELEVEMLKMDPNVSVLLERNINGTLLVSRMLFPALDRPAIAAIVLASKSTKGTTVDVTLGERALQALILGGFLHRDLRKWLITIVAVEISRKGVTEDVLANIAKGLDLTTITDGDACERQIDLKINRRNAIRSFASSLTVADFVKVHHGQLLTKEQYKALRKAPNTC